MKQTTIWNHRFFFAIAFAFSLPTLLAGFGTAFLTPSNALAQTESTSKRETKREASTLELKVTHENIEDVLAQTRKAMNAGKLKVANALLLRAEGANLRYPVLHFGDTPAKVRRDLKKLAKSKSIVLNGKSRKEKSRSLFATQSKEAITDPFVSGANHQTGGKANPFRTAKVAETAKVPDSLGVPNETSNNKETSPKAICDSQLLAARRALAVGDAARAEQHLQRAQMQNVSYAASEESPQRVAQSIHVCRQYTAERGEKSSDPAWRQGYAKFLVEQANALAEGGDLKLAEQVASEAVQLHAPLADGTNVAENTLRRIQYLRSGDVPASAIIAPATAVADSINISTSKAQTMQLLADAREALAAGDLQRAETLAGEASRLDVPDSQFAPSEDRPAKLALDVQKALSQQKSVTPASSNEVTPASSKELMLTLPLQLPQTDEAAEQQVPRIAQLPTEQPAPLPGGAESLPSPGEAFQLIREGEQALRSGDRAGALALFQAAHQIRNQLDPLSQQQLQSHLQMLSSRSQPSNSSNGGDSLLSAADSGSQLVARQLSADIGKRQSDAARIRTSDPNQALEILQEARGEVEKSDLDNGTKTQLLRRVDLSLAETRRYIRDHQAEIELDESNRAILEDIDRSRAVKVQVRQKVAELVDQYNQLRDEQRYAEMEAVARRLYAMAPNEPIAQQILDSAKFIRRSMLNRELTELSENGVANSILDLKETSGEALRDSIIPYRHPDTWDKLTKGRKGSSEISHRQSPRELEIKRKLKTRVLPQYDAMPLTQVIEGLSELAGVNIHLDPRGLSQEGVRSDSPITLNLSQEISLESALNLILEPLHLTFMIKDEVLKVTSEQLRDGDVYARTYYVTDLVVPIPNFTPNSSIGLQGLINESYAAMGHGPQGPGFSGPVALVAGNRPGQQGLSDAGGNALAQQFGASGSAGGSMPTGGMAGGQGGAANADFDSLIDLIITTVEHESWMENGTGEGEITEFPLNFSLVISQTQRVHEQIADLLEQLRSLQDLQVTIEVRFIRLTDSFFERIGIDFDLNIEDGSGITDLQPGSEFEGSRASATVGINQNTNLGDFPNFTASLDVPFRQESFGLTLPQFGGQQAVSSFGFAILSDIEAFFLINASQGDQRANVLQAPKVTLFNGQQAIILDTAFVPFVISVIPVVGEFAAAQQPVIVVLSEGTMMTVRAVVSDDRRYVRLTLVPFFSQIGNVQTFTFEGSETSTNSSNTTDVDDDGNNETDDNATNTVRSGTTVQLPTFEIISIATTVSVPDGGTVLLGGIKRLSEGRNEFGVPLLSKVPYIDRLFRNVGIGRTTDSLMMMVTPHIIIQEEEEDKLGSVQP